MYESDHVVLPAESAARWTWLVCISLYTQVINRKAASSLHPNQLPRSIEKDDRKLYEAALVHSVPPQLDERWHSATESIQQCACLLALYLRVQPFGDLIFSSKANKLRQIIEGDLYEH